MNDIVSRETSDDAVGAFQSLVSETQEVDQLRWLQQKAAQQKQPEQIEQPVQEQQQEVEQPETEEEGEGFLGTAKNAVADVLKGGTVELVPQTVGGVVDALGELGDTLQSAFPAGGLQIIDPETGEFDLELLNAEEFDQAREDGTDLFSEISPEEAQTNTGGFVRATSQFLTGFVPAMRGAKALGLANTAKASAGSAVAAGALTDAVFFDPFEDRLSTYLNEVPSLEPFVSDWLADNNPENQSEWEGRIKNAIEGTGLGLAADGLIKAFRYYKRQREAGGGKREARTVQEQKIRDQLTDTNARPLVDDVTDDQIAELGNPDVDDLMIEGGVDETLATAMERLRGAQGRAADVNPGQLAQTVDPENTKIFINHARINTPDDVRTLIQNAAEADQAAINAARSTDGSGVVSNAETIKASDQEFQDLTDLIGRDPGPMTASQAVASRRIMVASGEQVQGLAARAIAPDASKADLFAFRRAMVVHYAIQAEVIAARTETARALQSYSIFTGADNNSRRIVCAI